MLVGDGKPASMSITKKLRVTATGRPVSQLTCLKALWRILTEDQRSGWSALPISNTL